MVLTGMKLSQTLSMAFSQLLFDFGFMFPFTVIQTGGKERTTEELGFSPPTLSQPIWMQSQSQVGSSLRTDSCLYLLLSILILFLIKLFLELLM